MNEKDAVKLGTLIAKILIVACNPVPDEHYPLDDFWIAIAPDWDLNVYRWNDVDKDGNSTGRIVKATIYPVVTVGGVSHTVTDVFVSLDVGMPILKEE